MENLNDVEFGSNDNEEEAPILIAQRHLNIFRQVHIFNKAKRDQFDDELLALPDVVINYIKKMPGGRLLIEHLEEVKTNRGISFVKSSSEDFISPDDAPSATTPAVAGGAGPAQYVGGSLTMDASFAETFAKSMAEAFKQIPTPTITAASGTSALPADFSHLFDAVTEEIRASRASLLDVLKETRNITDSVIASQVSISRILEGILSSQNKGDSDTATMNNRIIASQASITKLLENLYTSNAQKNDEISTYLDVDRKLQNFRAQLEQTINNSLSSIVSHIYDASQQQGTNISSSAIDSKLAGFKSEIEAEVIKHLTHSDISSIEKNTESYDAKPRRQIIPDYEENNSNDSLQIAINERKKKKKKKKKNSETFSEEDVLNSPENSFVSYGTEPDAMDTLTTSSQNQQDEKIGGIIRNGEYKHDDNFDNINLDEPPLEDDFADEDIDLQTTTPNTELSTVLSQSKDDDELEGAVSDDDNVASLDGLLDNLPDVSATPEDDADLQESSIPVSEDDASLDSFMDDTLEFSPSEQEVSDDIAVSTDSDGIQDDAQSDLNSLSDFMNDGLDFALPEQGSALDGEESSETNISDNASSGDLSSLGDFMDDGLDFALPEQGAALASEDDVEESQNTDLPQIDESNSVDELDSLDDLLANNVADEPSSESANNADDINLPDANADENVAAVSTDDFNSLDDLADESSVDDEAITDNSDNLDELDTSNSQNSEDDTVAKDTFSKYSSELDKIRAALTGDNIDISSINQPIALDDYDDDANVENDDEWAPSQPITHQSPDIDAQEEPNEPESQDATTSETSSSDEDWEWEYVDENGNPVSDDGNGDENQDWEWEYVEDDSSETEDNNKQE